MKGHRSKPTRIDTIIGKGTFFEGRLSSTEGLRIDGKVRGKIECACSLVIGAEGEVEGEIIAETVCIAGALVGNVTARKHLEIVQNGRVNGDISTENLVIDEGVVFEGRCRMLSSGSTPPPPEEEPLPALPLPFQAKGIA
jgi:cytoskeletal protein CcmA (bactofilin family)